MLIERLMWGADWDARLTALLTSREAPGRCAACDSPIERGHGDADDPLLCVRCEADEPAS